MIGLLSWIHLSAHMTLPAAEGNVVGYSHYKPGRERQRKQAERGREEADRSAELGREEVRRGREYEERYAAERAAEEPQTEAPRDDMGKPE